MDQKEIYDLLNNGWIYCESEPYFERSFFSHVKEKKKFGRGYFVKKSQSLFDRLVALGMPKNSQGYDKCVVMFLSLKGNRGSFNMLSLKESGEKGEEQLMKVSADILAKGL